MRVIESSLAGRPQFRRTQTIKQLILNGLRQNWETLARARLSPKLFTSNYCPKTAKINPDESNENILQGGC